MSDGYHIKDKVVLKNDKRQHGIIVDCIGRGKYKILWDRDWHTGRTYIHSFSELFKANEQERLLDESKTS